MGCDASGRSSLSWTAWGRASPIWRLPDRGGGLRRSPAAIPLERVVRSAAAGWAPVARSAGRGLRVRWEGAPAVVSADSGRLAQALGNLVANAVEHGSGPVELRGRRAGHRGLVEVRDTGPAGAEGARGDRTDRGHGLSIAAQAVEEAGGRLTLEKTQEGTLAAVELPLVEP